MNESVKRKSKGSCPFCKEEIRPIILEENTLRRDKCECPTCNEIIYVCRIFGCENFAKGGDIYDDEFCPECAKNIQKTIGGLGKGMLTIVGLGIATAISKKIGENNKNND